MIFFLATPLFIISGVPQTIKLLKTKRSNDIATGTYLMTTIAVLLMLIHSIQLKDMALIWANGSSFILTSINLILILKYKTND